MTRRRDTSVFPIPAVEGSRERTRGITLREYAAVHILAGMLASDFDAPRDEAARLAVLATDALIAELAE